MGWLYAHGIVDGGYPLNVRPEANVAIEIDCRMNPEATNFGDRIHKVAKHVTEQAARSAAQLPIHMY
jgi:hypothetical protein